MVESLCGIVLAAGMSRRFGEPKQLLVHNNQTLVSRAVDVVTEVTQAMPLVVVQSDQSFESFGVTTMDAVPIVNPNYAQGIGSSIAAAATQIPTSVAGALILAVDQPLITAEDLKTLKHVWLKDTDCPVACRYRDTVGIPAIFPKRLFSELQGLQGDRGAKKILQSEKRLATLTLPTAAFDIDTKDDWKSFTRNKLG
ncbi:MAG: nucleotidyltransferase family protein [Pseudomonadota bacterium]